MPHSRNPPHQLPPELAPQSPALVANETAALFQHALQVHQAGRLGEAEAGYRQLLAIDPHHADAFYLLGVLQQGKGDLDTAKTLFHQALAIREDARFLFCLASLLHDTKRLPEAEAAYRRTVELMPNHAEAFNKLGNLLCESNQLLEAESAYRCAIDVKPDYPQAHNNLANLLMETARLPEAELAYRRALALKSDYGIAHLNLGNLLKNSERLPEAEAAYRHALQLLPNRAEVHYNLGQLFAKTRRMSEAETAYNRALQLMPTYAEAWNSLGNLHKETERPREAEAAYRRALDLNPNYPEVYSNLGSLFMQTERFPEAETAYSHVIALSPHSADAHNNLGILLQEANRPNEAEAAYRRALDARPDFPEVYNNFGNLLRETGRFSEAELAYRQAIDLNPNYAEAHNNLGTVLKENGQLDAALASCRRALDVAPDNSETHLNFAFLLLQAGDLATGWQEYEYRWKISGNLGANKWQQHFAQPLWLGDADPAGKIIFLHAEQGYGDTLQFARYATLLAGRGAKVYLGVPSALKSLMASCAGVAAVYASGDTLPPFDYHCPMMSLPLAFGTELRTIPAPIPYLAGTPSAVTHWREKLADRLCDNTALRVGLAWAGNPHKHMRAVHTVDRQRSLEFDQLRPLLDIPGIQFFSLQLGDEAVLQLKGNPKIIDYTSKIGDFQDTAALIDNLDLVISVDTSVAHLAGAIGKPVWMLNRFNTCWRWLMDREDSPWYPTMRIFRQQSPGDWGGVIGNVKSALEKKVNASDAWPV